MTTRTRFIFGSSPRNLLPLALKALSLSLFLFTIPPHMEPVVVAQEPAPSIPSVGSKPMIRMSLLVTDRSNHSLDVLTREEIQISEDKKPQTLLLFAKDERPVYYGLVIDASKSFLPVLGSAIFAAKLIINNNRAGDETFIETFVSSDKIARAQDFTLDKTVLLKSFDSVRVEGGSSAVIDGVYLAAEHTVAYRRTDQDHRRALVLISDGEDRASHYKLDALVNLLRENEVQIFVIGIVKELDKEGGFIRSSPGENAEKLLTRLAQETGGRVFFPNNMSELAKAVAEIVHDLHAQFAFGYQSTNNSGESAFRKVDVKIAKAPGREKLTAITRLGYWVNANAPNSKKKEKKSP
jgi:Ca-activated chloride channel family protein